MTVTLVEAMKSTEAVVAVERCGVVVRVTIPAIMNVPQARRIARRLLEVADELEYGATSAVSSASDAVHAPPSARPADRS